MTLEERLASSLPDRYAVQGEIGRGGMASVFLAEDRKHHRRVAIKVLHPELSEALGAKRFLREIRTAAGLTHPHILTLHDSGEADGLLFYIMPYVRGESLRARLEREHQLSVQDAVRITLEVASALAYAHGEGFVHRDVKPANVLLESGQTFLADFGLAQALAGAEGSESRLTQTGIFVGTPAYMSPEQAAGQEYLDGQSDQYSLACVLYEMLAGQPAFTGATTHAILAQKLTAPPPPLTLFRSAVSRELEEVIGRALQKTPADRFPSMADFSAALQAGPPSPKPARPKEGSESGRKRGWNWSLLATAATAIVLMVGWAIGWFDSNEPPWSEGYPQSIVVLPFNAASSSQEEGMAATEVADLLARELDRWDSIRALGSAALTGVIHDLGLTEPTFRSSEAALEVARRADAEALLGITVRIQRDSAFVQGTLYDASNGELAGPQILAQGRWEDLSELVPPIAFSLLGIGEVAIPLHGHGTRNLSAFRSFLGGHESFLQTNLSDAKNRFLEATRLDSAYAPALSWLALVLYWQGTEGDARLSDLRPDIARFSTFAQDRLATLRGTDSLHVDAFFHFQRGDFEESRTGYRKLVESTPEDIVGWLMLGELELNDLWMVPDSSGAMRPRADLNQALEAFQRTTRIRPTFELGYARTFEVTEDLETAARTRSCPLFGLNRAAQIPPGSGPGVENAEAFCPVFQDSIVWVPKAEFDSMAPERIRSGVDQVFDRAVMMLDAWERFAPEAPRPKELIAEVLISRRDGMGTASPQRLRTEAARALEHTEAALSLRTDTTAEDLFLVANLRLASGAAVEALSLAREALALHKAEPDSIRGTPPLSAANVFLASGQLATALWIARHHSGRRFVPDPATGELIDYAGAEPIVFALAILGAGGVTGEPVLLELERLDSTWTEAGYSPRQKQVLRNAITSRIGTALALDSAAYRIWGETVDVAQGLWGDLGLPPGNRISDEDYSIALAAASHRTDRAMRTFLVALRAGELGAASTAQRAFARLDSLPHKVGAFDSGWGLAASSLIPLAETLEKQGEHEAAVQTLARFLSIWQEPDSLGQLTVQRARARLERIQTGLGG